MKEGRALNFLHAVRHSGMEVIQKACRGCGGNVLPLLPEPFPPYFFCPRRRKHLVCRVPSLGREFIEVQQSFASLEEKIEFAQALPGRIAQARAEAENEGP